MARQEVRAPQSPEERRADFRARVALGLLLFLFLAAGLIILPIPFTRDQGIYAYNAWRWLGGTVPYRDTFDHKGPVLYAIYAVALNLARGAMWGPNIADLIARAATVIFIYLIGAGLARRRAGLFAAILAALPLAGIFNSCWWNAQAETFMMPLMAASAWLCVRRSDSARAPQLLLAGLLAGQAIMLKPTAAAHMLLLIAWAGAIDERAGARRGADLAALLAGLVAGVGCWIAYFAAKHALGPMAEFLVLFNWFHAGAPAGTAPVSNQLRVDLPRIFSFAPLLALLLVVSLGEDEGRRGKVFILGWVTVSLLQVLSQRKFFPYHWLVVIPPLALAAGVGLDYLFRAAAKWLGRVPALLAASLIFAGLFYIYGRDYWLIEESYQTRAYLEHRISLEQYYARFNAGDARGRGDFNLLASVAVASRLRLTTPPEATVLVFGYEPIVNYLAARPAPTRFEADYPLTFTPRTDRARALRDKWRAQFLFQLAAAPPSVVILVDHDINSLEPEPSTLQARAFTEFWNWLNANYKEAERIEDFQFYRRK